MSSNTLAQSSPVSGGYGLRLGVANRLSNQEIKPVIAPYYEAHVGSYLLSAELLLTYQNFSTLDFFTFQKFDFDSYGFGVSIERYFGQSNGILDRIGAGPQLSVLRTRVSIGLALSGGMLFPLGEHSWLDFGVFATPLTYIGIGGGLLAGITAGIRFADQ